MQDARLAAALEANKELALELQKKTATLGHLLRAIGKEKAEEFMNAAVYEDAAETFKQLADFRGRPPPKHFPANLLACPRIMRERPHARYARAFKRHCRRPPKI